MGVPTSLVVASQTDSAPFLALYLSFPSGSDSKESACNAGQSLGWEDLLEKGMAIHSSVLAWRIPWTEEPGGLHSMGLQRVRHDWGTHTFTFTSPFHSNSLAYVLPDFKCSSSTSSGSLSDPFGLRWFMLFEAQSYFYCFIWHLFSIWRFIYFYPYCLILNCVLLLVFL